ncbi:MAG: FG-GAP-like repeat-containing protein, partial [Melioribacteraceae bacterium]|nr:FG-GAP-like repeat-containing protein [Melioribacteraceae bacterium]
MKRLTAILFIIPIFFVEGQIFERVTDDSNPIVSTSMTANYSGAAWIDYNNDGLIDLFSSRSFLFKNLGAGEFEYIETALGENSFGQSNGVTWSDYDNDGNIDLFMAGNPSNLYKNLGNDSFTRIQTNQLNDDEDLRGWAAAWGDYDSDGFTDLVITHPRGFLGANPTSNHLYKNNGGILIRDNTTPVTDDIAPFTIPSFIDYDLDGDPDLFIGSGPAGTSARDFMYKNMSSETGDFSYIRIEDEEFATDAQDGQVWNFVDYDNDGDLDGFVTNYGGAKNKFYRNDDGVFTNIENELTISGSKLANSWGDFDNDGDLDVVVTGDSDNDLYLNNGDGSFSSLQHPIADLTSVSAALGDYDDDGDLDLFLSGGETALFENIIDNSNNWVLISLEGTVSNRSAIGAKIKAKANIDGKDVWQIREVSSQNSFNGHNSLRVHFGLKDATIIDSLIILWPNSPNQVFENVEINTIHKYLEPITENFIRVNFKSDIQRGFDLPEIQFTDLSTVDPNNPIVSWEWDFDNDGIIDATDQNPIWQYDSLGVYSVKLRISNGIESVERLKEYFIELTKTPGLPIITTLSHSFSDTTVQKGQRIEFSGAAIDTTGYEILYNWVLNSQIVDWDSTYRYAARTFPSIPRTDTLKFLASN